jgi:hypothetical protein
MVLELKSGMKLPTLKQPLDMSKLLRISPWDAPNRIGPCHRMAPCGVEVDRLITDRLIILSLNLAFPTIMFACHILGTLESCSVT